MTAPRSSRYSPRTVASADLEALLVGREVLVERIVSGVRGSILEGSARFELLVGPRGAGKSHLVGVLQHRLEADEELGARCVIAALDEEEHVGSLLDLLARVLGALPASAAGPSPAVETLRDHAGVEGERRAVAMIRGFLGERALLLIVENLDRVLSALGEGGQARLRAILQTEGRWSVLASSPAVPADLRRADRPFFHAFQERPIPPLDVVQCRELLRRLARHHGKEPLAQALSTGQGLARVRAVHHLLRGNPRAMALIFPYLEDASLDGLERSFFALADELTPYFQQRMAARSPAQQALLERLAESWRPLAVGELARASFASPQSTSSQLKKLLEDGLVQRMALGRESFYEIADPLWRIARAMKRPDRAPVALVHFLACWHPAAELRELPVAAAPPVTPALVREVFGFRGEPDPFAAALGAEVLALLDAKRFDEAVEKADLGYRTQPGANSALLLQWALALAARWERLTEAAEEAEDRFGAEAVALGFAIFAMFPERDRTGLRDRVRPALLAEGEEPPLRALVDLGLLLDGQAAEADLIPAARRIAAASMGVSAGLLAALRRHGHARCVLAFSGREVPPGSPDGLAILWALVETGARGLAAQKLDAWLGAMEDGPARAAFAMRGGLLVGDHPRAVAAALEALEAWPVGATSLPLLQEVVRVSGDHRLRKNFYRFLALRYPEIPAFTALEASLHLLSGDYPEAARLARTAPASLLLDQEPALALLVLDPGDLAGLPDAASSAEAAFARALAANLAGVEAGVPPEDPNAGFLLVEAWLARLLAGPADLAARNFLRFLARTGPECCTTLLVVVQRVACATVAYGRDRQTLESLVQALERTLEREIPFLRATLALPDDLRPFVRLAAPERELVRAPLRSLGPPCQALLAKLPAEPTPVG